MTTPAITPDLACPERPCASSIGRERLASIALLLTLVALWTVQHTYHGLWHDARLYLLQALAHLKPALLANDIFIRYGSQDNYTLFSPLYARAIGLLGIEPATAGLTFLCQVAFITSAWLLARRLLPARLAWLGTGLLLALPAEYGAYRTFSYLEDFLTPRLPAEAFVLAGLSALLTGRPLWTWVLLIAGGLLHPLMAAGGVAVVLCVQLAFPRPRLAAMACAVFAAGALIVLNLTPLGASLRFDEYWLKLVHRTPYLFVSLWRIEDWTFIAIPLGTLAVGTLTLQASPARTLCSASLLAAVAGIALSWIGADLLQLVPIAQLQPWRCLWIAGVLAVLLLPLIVTRCWDSGAFGRTAALLVISLWALRGELYALELLPLALGAAVMTMRSPPVPPRLGRLMMGVAWLLCLLAMVWTLANIALLSAAVADETHAGTIVGEARPWFREGTIPALLLIGIYWAVRKASSTGLRILTGGLLATLAITIPSAARSWTWVEFPSQVYEAFGSWRRLIPTSQEVFWVDGPVASWVLLEHPNYLSLVQAAGAVFSRRAAMELDQRQRQLEPFATDAPGEYWDQIGGPRATTRPTLAQLCKASEVKFIATRADLQAAPLAVAPPGVPPRYRMLRLYGCAPAP